MDEKYLSIIRSAKSCNLELPSTFQFSPDENQVGISVVPPLNCDIRFRLGTFSLVLPKFTLTKEEEQLPLNWKNYIDIDTDKNDEQYNEKMLSTIPVNQGHCGSCFAVAIATVISDNFVFGMKLDYNPSLSPMYILSCLAPKDKEANNRCGGGNPSLVVDDIINNGGISTNCFQNYYKICDSNQYCNGKGEEHMNRTISMTDVDTMIPECGNCSNTPPKFYQIKNKRVAFDIPTIKLHIKKFGAAVGGFIVYQNFMGDKSRGKFDITKGIYINSVNYSDDDEFLTIKGGHAISIVGWGTEQNVPINGKNYPKVDYWVCRNSWGPKWGNNGYFKYAMYQEYKDLDPINKGVAFETDNTLEGATLGGIILIEPSMIVDKQTNKVQCNVNYDCDLELQKPKPKPHPIIHHFHSYRYYYIGFTVIIAILVLLYYIFFPRHHRKRSHRKRSHRKHKH